MARLSEQHSPYQPLNQVRYGMAQFTGYYYSKDSGTTWTEISDSTFHLTVQSTYEAQETLDGKIYVTTLGNGLLVGA
jgi:hypothetical protein